MTAAAKNWSQYNNRPKRLGSWTSLSILTPNEDDAQEESETKGLTHHQPNTPSNDSRSSTLAEPIRFSSCLPSFGLCFRIFLALAFLTFLCHQRRLNIGLVSYADRTEYTVYYTIKFPPKNSQQSLEKLRKIARSRFDVGVRSWGTTVEEGLGRLENQAVPRWSQLLLRPIQIQFASTDNPQVFSNLYQKEIVPSGETSDTCGGHSHNDYEQEFPLTTALAAKFCSIEADIIYCPPTADRLTSIRLGHTDIYSLDQSAEEAAICAQSTTLQETYIEPLLKHLEANPTYCQSCSPTPGVQLLIDIKDPNSEEGMKLLSDILYEYEERMEGKIYTILSGIDDLRAMTSPYRRYPNLKVDGRPIDVFLPAFASPVLTNTLFIIWLLVVGGEWARKKTQEKEQRFRLNFVVQVTKHVMGLSTLLLVDAVIISLLNMAALYGYVLMTVIFVLPLASYYWRKFMIGLRIIWNLCHGIESKTSIPNPVRKQSDTDEAILLRAHALANEGDDDDDNML